MKEVNTVNFQKQWNQSCMWKDEQQEVLIKVIQEIKKRCLDINVYQIQDSIEISGKDAHLFPEIYRQMEKTI